MPAVEVAMRRSLREGFGELLVASFQPVLGRRQSLVDQANDVKVAFSSWDNCMAVTYCKWPVIAVIIVGGLILFSVVWCIIRCACCGLSCCCECFQCLKCCGNCCGMCDPPRGKRHKYLDEPYIPPNQGYKSHPPMNPHFPPVVPTMTPAATGISTGVASTSASASIPPQYAEFDVSKSKGGDDSLPAMPSWDDAGKQKVFVEEDAVEMDQLKKPDANGQASGQNGAMPVGAAGSVPGQRTPVGSPGINRSPYGPPAGGPGSNGYFPASGLESDYPPAGGGYNQLSPRGQDQGYGMAGRRSPYDGNAGYSDAGYGYGQSYGAPTRQDSYSGYGVDRHGGDGYGNYRSPQENQGYGPGAHQSPPNELVGDSSYDQGTSSHARSPVYDQHVANQSPAPQAGYGQDLTRRSPGPQTMYGGYSSSNQYPTEPARPLRSPPQRQYSHDTQAAAVQSDAGFDFGASGYSRPAAGYRQPSPVQQPAGYPGYKPYQQGGGQQQGGRGW